MSTVAEQVSSLATWQGTGQGFQPTHARMVLLNEVGEGQVVDGDLRFLETDRGLAAVETTTMGPKGRLHTFDDGLRSTKIGVTTLGGPDSIGELRYGPYLLKDIMENCTSTEAQYLMLNGELPNPDQLAEYEAELKKHADVSNKIRGLINNESLHGMHPMNFMQMAFNTMDPKREVDSNDPKQVRDACIKSIAATPMIIAYALKNFYGHGDNYKIEFDPSLHYSQATAKMLGQASGNKNFDTEIGAKFIDWVIKLHLEHGFNASTSTARLAQSAHANPFGSIAAAVEVLAAPDHGGACEVVHRQNERIGDPDNVKNYLETTLAKKGAKVYGVGHRVYRDVDPRLEHAQKMGEELIAAAQQGEIEVSAQDRIFFEIAQRIFDVCPTIEKFAKAKQSPNVDLKAGAAEGLMGVPAEFRPALFFLGRVGGYCGHLNQMAQNRTLVTPNGQEVKTGGPIMRGMELDLSGPTRELPAEYGLRGKDHVLLAITQQTQVA